MAVAADAQLGASGERTDPPTAGKRRLAAVLVPYLLLLILWVWSFQAEGAFAGGPSGKAFGADFAMFVNAARVLERGGNPYDHQLLYRTERAALQQEGLPILKRKATIRVGNPPLLFWLLEPVTRLPFQPASLAWSLLLYLLDAAALLALLRAFRWRRYALPMAVLLLSPQIIFGPFYGNVVSLCFVGVVFGLVLAGRQPVLAGALLTAAWLKPPIGLPLVLLIVLFHAPHRRPLLAGFAGTSLGLLLASIATTGWHTVLAWLTGMAGYSRDIASSPSIASLSGLYVRVVPPPARTALEAAVLLSAVLLTAWTWHRSQGRTLPVGRIAWLWAVWFLAAPYAHFYDEILLSIPVLAALGGAGDALTTKSGAGLPYLALLALLLISRAPGGVQLLSLPLIGIAVCLFLRSQRFEVPVWP